MAPGRSARGISRAARSPKIRNGVVESGTAAATRNGPNTAASAPAVTATVARRRPVRPAVAAASLPTSHVRGATNAPNTTLPHCAAAYVWPSTAMDAALTNVLMGIHSSNAGFGSVSGGVA